MRRYGSLIEIKPSEIHYWHGVTVISLKCSIMLRGTTAELMKRNHSLERKIEKYREEKVVLGVSLRCN